MSKLVSIQQAAEFLGVSVQTLRRWEVEGKKLPVQRTKGGQRRYDLTQLAPSKSSKPSKSPKMNYHKRGLKKLINRILCEDIGRLVITHKDRLLRFGAELVFAICEMKNVEVVLVNKGDEPSFEEELAQDVLEIITVFSARLYGSRSRKNKKLIENLQEVVKHG